MTELLEKALKAVEILPPDRQDAVVAVILDYIQDKNDSVMSAEQLAEVHRRLANPNREFVSLEEVRRGLT